MPENVTISLSLQELQDLIAQAVAKCLTEHPSLITVHVAETEVIGIDQAARLLRCSKGYLYKLTSSRVLPHYKKGKIVYFLRSELVDWIKTGRIKTNEELDIEAATYVTLKKGRRG